MLFIALVASVAALAFAGFLVWLILKQEIGTERMKEIYEAIREGAKAYLNRQYKTLLVFMVVTGIILGLAVKWNIGVSFIVGACCSALAGYIGMNVAVRANARTANAAQAGLSKALSVAFRGGAVMGLCMVGLALLGVTVFYAVWREPILFAGFGFGGSLVALFARIGGGIYTKSADVGADLVGKVEAGIPEDDPRNPAVIADCVGDNVGDVAGMAADLFETYAVTIIGAMLLGAFPAFNVARVEYPLLLGAVAIFATIAGTFFVRVKEGGSPTSAILRGIAVTAVISVVGFYFLTVYTGVGMGIFYAAIVGVVITVLLCLLTNYYTSYEHQPVRRIAEASQAGPGINIITGLANAMESTILPIIVICVGVVVAYLLAGGGVAGFYGVAVAAMAMLSIAGIIVSVDAYGPIVDNAGGIAEMANLKPEVREVTDTLDAVGNTTKALTKVFAIGSAGLAALSLLFAYILEVSSYGAVVSIENFGPIMNARVLVGLLLGGGLAFIFSSLCMKGVGRGAFMMVSEVRRQFREIVGIMEGKTKPDYARCVDISVRTALRGMALPGLLAVVTPIIVGFILGAEALGGLLVGAIVTGLALALFMANGGGAWDNAKKYVETGKLGGKRSPTHAATVIGDTVGDPFKDTAGPAINPMIKAINMLSVIIAPLIVMLVLI